MDDNLRREIILDNYQDPYNKGLIDNLDFILKKDNDIIVDIRFDGEACAISTSASSIMIRKLIGMNVNSAKELLTNYKNMIEGKDYDENLLGELNVYDKICNQPNRKNCALLPSRAVDELLSKL